jgi:acetate kinase
MENKRSIATTMGFTALEGLPMGTRCGSLDPGILLYLLTQNYDLKKLNTLLYHQSGLLGLSGVSSDVRVLLANKSEAAKAAIDFFVYRIVRELGSLAAALHGLDAIVFTAGIGEHSAEIRKRVCEQAAWMGIEVDKQANLQNAVSISTPASKIKILIIPTNEEIMIAQHTWDLWEKERIV